jgi:tetratricopeptide (TPR) repeat protein
MRSLCIALLLLSGTVVRADHSEARAHYERATSAYALGNYAEAADEYEKAFALKADRALLYNAAQARRLSGNKERALLLYQNYLRVFGDNVAYHTEVERHIANLKAAIEKDHEVANSPPVTPEPMHPAPPPEKPIAPAPAPTPTPTPAIVPGPTAVTVAPAERPVWKKPWFWVAIGGAAAVVAIGVGVGVGVGGAPHDPQPSIASVMGN